MKSYLNSVQSTLESLNQNLTRVLVQLCPQAEASKIYQRFHTASMSHTRLKALEGPDRQTFLDKLREEADHGASKARWIKGSEDKKIETPEEAEENRKRKIFRAQQRQSQERLKAWVATLSPEELEENDREGKRLSGPDWQLPTVLDPNQLNIPAPFFDHAI